MADNIVITMAGRGSRFFDAGYTVPKYEIMAHGRSLFEWSMLSLKNFISDESRVIFVCLAENHSSDYVRRHAQRLGIKNVEIVELDEITDGQATTAFVSQHRWDPKGSLLIYNIDTFVKPGALQPAHIRPESDGWIPCFQADGNHWSFVKISEEEWAERVAEKSRISDYASIGLYWFLRSNDFLTAYDAYFADSKNLVKGERYIAPLYSYLIDNGKKISIADLSISSVHVLGTPSELQIFIAKDESEI